MPVNSALLASAGQQIPAIKLGQDAAAAAYNADRLGFLLATARECGPVVQLWPGLILVTGPAEADAVFRRTGRDFFSTENFLLRKIDHRPGADYMTSWLRSRRAALEGTTPALLSHHAGWLADHSRTFVADWLARGNIRDAPRELERLTSESIATFSFGAGPAGVPAAAQAMLDALFPVFSSPFVFPAYMRLFQPREWRVRRRLRDLHAELARAMAGRSEASLATALAGQGLDGSSVIRVLTSMHLAGHGVPAAALAWAIVELARNPAEQDMAATSAARWNGSRDTIPGQIGRVVDETLRLWPPSWLSDRVTSQPVSCGAWAWPGNARILLPLWVIHRTAACYPDPERFDSSRWLGLKPEPGAYLPFGMGPHWCLGARLARLELEVFLTVLLSRASIAVRGTVKPDARRTLTLSGFELEITPR